MTNEEAVKVIESEHVWLPRTYGWCKVEDAHKMAIKALENHERMQRELKSLNGIADTCDKLERALDMAVHDSDKSGTDIWCHDCPYDDDERLDHCCDCGVKYYKRQAGIDS